MISRILKAFLSLSFATQPTQPTQPRIATPTIVCGTGEGGWDEDDMDHLRKQIKK